MSAKKRGLGTPPSIEETLDTLHKAEVEMVKQHIKENPSIIEQSGVILERPAVEAHEPGSATPDGEVNPATSPAKGKSPKSGPRGSAKKEEEKIPLQYFQKKTLLKSKVQLLRQ